jgi:hypothetical protein
MTMILDKVTGKTANEQIPMNSLKSGEVGYCAMHDSYVLRIGSMSDTKFLILGNHNDCNWYDLQGAKGNCVRRLNFEEEVHMIFKRKGL